MIPKYRADIDGLRAVAVLSVVLFHLGASVFSGGYVGVDVFFVISGYLITTIIVREIADDSFSIARFYERRARRILPALAAVITAALVVGSLVLAPDGLVELGRSAVAAALFSSNILFFLESGYFEGPAEMKPLLHTWSLAIEEQYYIFFPMLLVLIAKLDGRRYLKWLTVLGSLSLIACVIWTRVDSSAAFYLIPTRAWELFIGSILALRVFPSPDRRYVRETIATLGILLIAYAVFGFTPETNFPGFAATVPTVGTALIIHSGLGGRSLVSRALSLRPVVFIGLISYSLYLWHWPVIAYVKLYSITDPGAAEIAVMAVVIFGLSVLSWRYVEIPFRRPGLIKRTGTVLGTSSVVIFAIVCSGLLMAKQGRPERNESSLTESAEAADSEWERWESCEKASEHINSGDDLCDIGAPSGEFSFLLWGDSQARALASGVQLSAAEHGLRGKLATQIACPPLTSIERPSRTTCHEFNQAVLDVIAGMPEIETVILAARWALSTTGTRYKEESGRQVQLVDIQSPNATSVSNVTLFNVGLVRTIDRLRNMGKRVVLVRPVPEIGYDVPSAHFAAELTGRDVNLVIAPTSDEYAQRTRDVTSIFKKVAKGEAVELVDPSAYLCKEGRCRVVADDMPLYRDDDHLSTFGSRYVSPAFDAMFTKIASGRVRTTAHERGDDRPPIGAVGTGSGSAHPAAQARPERLLRTVQEDLPHPSAERLPLK